MRFQTVTSRFSPLPLAARERGGLYCSGTRFDAKRAIRCATLLLVVATFFVLDRPLRAAGAAMKAFDLPAGMANESLKKFSAQSGLEVIFPTGITRRIRTSAVKGEYTDGEAMTRLLEGSGLIAIRDEKSGAFTVMRGGDGNAPEQAPPPSSAVKKNSSHQTKA